MKRDQIFVIFIFFLLLLSFYWLYRILSPFLTSVLWAILLAIVFYPLLRRLQRLIKRNELLCALTMTVLVTFMIVLPFSLLAISLANEVVGAYHWVEEILQTGRLQTYLDQIKEIPFFQRLWDKLYQYEDISQTHLTDFLLKNLQQVSTFLFDQTSKIIKGLSTFVIGFFFTLLSLYYLFKDGAHLFERIKDVIPLPFIERDLLINRFKDMVYATIYGGILIAIIQGLLGGIIFWILGFSSPILWGTAMSFLSFIPIGGTAIVWIPAVILLFIQGAFLKGIILLFLGIFVIGMADNFLRPMFISARTKIHPLFLFFAVLGGVQVFGLIGLVMGPLIATLSLTLIEIYIQGIK
jgi:predicted PurR-regulated permease PerM